MSEKLVTHQDLDTIEDARHWIANVPVGQEAISGKARVLDLLDRLRVEAEADQPPLPEPTQFGAMVEDSRGRVFIRTAEQASVWRQTALNSDGRRYLIPDARFCEWSEIEQPQLLTPLRPAVTEAVVERAAVAYMSDGEDDEWDEGESEAVKDRSRFVVRIVLAAAGVVVEP